MASFNKQPNTYFDLVASYEGDGTTSNEILDIRAFVLKPDGVEHSSSPFTLVHKSYGVYQLNNAFVLSEVGVYKIVYRAYSTYPTRDYNWREITDLIDVKYEEVGGPVVVGGGGADMAKSAKDIAEAVWRYDISQIKNPKTAIKQILEKLDIEIPEVRLDEVLSEISKIPSKITIPEVKIPEADYSEVIDEIIDLKNSLDILESNLNNVETGLNKKLSDINLQKNLQNSTVEIVNKLKRHFDIQFSSKSSNEFNKFFNILDILNKSVIDNDINRVFQQIIKLKDDVSQSNQNINGLYGLLNQLNKGEVELLQLYFDNLYKIIDKRADKQEFYQALENLNNQDNKKLKFVLQEIKKAILGQSKEIKSQSQELINKINVTKKVNNRDTFRFGDI
jgi:hypothetical protein